MPGEIVHGPICIARVKAKRISIRLEAESLELHKKMMVQNDRAVYVASRVMEL
jgi:hypothetical protein